MASAGLYAKSASNPRQPRQHPTTKFFTGRMPFLPPNQQHQSTEGKSKHCSGLSGWAGTRRNIHPLTPIVIITHPLSASSIYCNPWHHPCSIYMPDSLFSQSLSQFSLVCLLVRHPPFHTPTNHCLLFAAHANTITTCFAALLKLQVYHLILVSILYLELYLSVTPHIHLTILISAR